MAVTPQAPLEAAVATLQAQAYPWFLPGYSIRLTDAAMYTTLSSTYGFGTPVIIGLSPADAATLTGLTLYTDGSIASQAVRPGIYVHPSQQTLLGVAISTNQASGTVMVSYANALGRFDRVIWKWQCDVQVYSNAVAYTPVLLGKWEQQVITYTGDGTAGRLIATTFALNSGVVAVWIYPQTADTPAFRHTGMSGTIMTSTPIVTTGGIMAFQSGGFTVTDDAPNSTLVNVLNRQYTAIVLRDSTSDNRFMHVGSYVGISAIVGGSGAFTLGSGTAIGPFTASSDVGRVFTSNMGGAFTGGVTSVDGLGNFTFVPVATATGTFSIDAAAGNRDISYTPSITSPYGSAPNQVWDFGRSGTAVFYSDDMAAGNSTSWGIEAKSLTDQIIAIAGNSAVASFRIGTNNNVNNSALTYYWVAFNIPIGDSVRNLFRTFVATGTGSVVQVTGLGFTPTFATARQFITGVPVSVWRSPWHSGTNSTQFDQIVIPTGGIRAFGSGTLDLGTAVLPNANTAYGFALASSGSVNVPDPNQPAGPPFAPPYPKSYAPPGAYVPTGVIMDVPGPGPAGPGVAGSIGPNVPGVSGLTGGAGTIGGGFGPCGCGPNE